MKKHHAAVTGFVAALALAAAPCAAHAVPAKVITSDTILKFGQKGVLPLDGYDKHFKIRKSNVAVRVTKIEKGKTSDLKGHGLPASATKLVPYYIHSELSYAGADFQGSPPLFGGQLSDGSGAGSVITSDDIGSCAHTSDIKLSKKQKTGRACEVALAPASLPVVSAHHYLSVNGHEITVTWTKTGK